MRRVTAVAVLVVVSLLLATGASGRDPRLERLQLRAADVALAKKVTLKQGDVGASWRPTRIPNSSGKRLVCPGFNPDLSRFTISGQASSGFTRTNGASIISSVEVYESRADAIGDFQTGAKPIVANCLKRSLEKELNAGGLVQATIPFARVVAAPRVGDRRIAYRIVARIEAANMQLDIYLDVVVVQRGRSIAAFFFTGPRQSLPGQAQIVSSAAARMR
jgi:hypothetical protein